MSIIIDTSGDEAITRSDLQVPADAKGSEIDKTIIVVDTFLEGDRKDTIEFVLDPRFRERVDAALQELVEKGKNIVFDSEREKLRRDQAQSIRVDLSGKEGFPRASIIMKHDLFREEQVPRIVDTEFKEFV